MHWNLPLKNQGNKYNIQIISYQCCFKVNWYGKQCLVIKWIDALLKCTIEDKNVNDGVNCLNTIDWATNP